MILRYCVVQRCDNGVWTECSCRYYLMGLDRALNDYKSIRLNHPNWKLRIARGNDDVPLLDDVPQTFL